MRRIALRLAILAGLLVGALGLGFSTAPAARADLSGCILTGSPVEGYVGQFELVRAGINGSTEGCNPEPSDVITYTLPSHLNMSSSVYPQAYDNGAWTCSWPRGGGKQVTCSPNFSYFQEPGGGMGIWFPVGQAAGSGDIVGSSPGLTDISLTSDVVTCTTPIPMFDAKVAGAALALAAFAGAAVLLLRRRRAVLA